MAFSDDETREWQGQPVELYKFQAGSEVWHVTSCATAQTFLGDVYTPIQISRSSYGQDRTGKRNALKVQIDHDHEIAQYFKFVVPYEDMELTIYRVHRGMSDYAQDFNGLVETARTDWPKTHLDVKPWDGQRNQPVLIPTYQHRCNWTVYDDRCGADPNVHGVDRTVSAISVDGRTITLSSSITGSDKYTGGVVRFANDNVMISEHDTSTVTTLTAVQNLILGSSIKILPSCMSLRQRCIDDFDNLENFFGFDVPTKDIYGPDGLKGNI